MNKASIVRIGAGALVLSVCLGLLGIARADTLDSSLCNQLYGLPAGTITSSISSQYLNPAVCAAMNDLISRYVNAPNSTCPSSKFTNPKVQAITSLNSAFALNLDNMLKAADPVVGRITIISAYRDAACEASLNPGGFGGNYSQSLHTKGEAADLIYPNDPNSNGGCDVGEQSKAYLWVNQNAATYGLGQYDQLHSHVNKECNHVEAKSSDGTMGPGNPGGTSVPQTQTPIYSSPPLGAPVTPGQTVSQNTQCQLSNGNVIIIPAGSQYPVGCTNNGAQISSGLQASCIGNTIAYNFSGTITTGQVCQAGCLNGACLATTCPAGSTLTNGVCAQQQCPAGYTMVGGLCNQTQQAAQQQAAQQAAQQQAAQQANSASNPASGATPANTITPSQVTPTPTLTTPTLVANIGATTTPITLGAAAGNISQLNAPAIPGVTYAQPTSALFPNGTQSSSGASVSNSNTNTNNNSNSNNNGITTTAGIGYDAPSGTDTGAAQASGVLAGTQSATQPGTNTFTPNDSLTSGTPNSFTGNAPSSFTNSALLILSGLKNELLGALGFLTNYLHPSAASAAPTQQGGE